MKKIIPILLVLASIGCNKNNDYVSINDSDPSTIIFTTQQGGGALPRISYIPNGAVDEYLSFSDHEIKVKFEGPQTAPEDITITYKVDAAALAKYNADQAAADPGYTPFKLMPDSTFTLLVTSDVIKKGEVYAPKVTNNLRTHPQKIDAATNYMIPITVSNSAYPSLAGGSSTIFYSFIGNILAGKYSWRYRRWQSGDTTTAPLQDILDVTQLAPINSTQLLTNEAYTTTFIDPNGGIVLNFSETGGVPSGFNTSLLPSTVAGITAGGFILSGAPKFDGLGFTLVGNLASRFIGTRFSTYIQFTNSSGGIRTLVNSFEKLP